MGFLWIVALLAVFALPAALLARLRVPPREHDPNNTGDAAIEMERTRRHEWR